MRVVGVALAGLAGLLSTGAFARHPGFEPGPRYSAHTTEAAGPRVEPGATGAVPATSDAAVVAAVDAVARRYNLAGEVLVARGGRVLLDRGYGTVRPDGGAAHRPGERWRLASITKQVTAALFLRQYLPAVLDLPVRELNLPELAEVTPRQLLTHHSGLPNPDSTPADTAGVPSFYRDIGNADRYCTSAAPRAGAVFSYNNCDYLMVGRLYGDLAIQAAYRRAQIRAGNDFLVITRPAQPRLPWPAGMTMAGPNEIGIPGFVGGKPEPAFQLASWGAAGGLMGTARAVFDFDRSLMTGRLLPPAALAELWKPEGNGSYQALGQWVFPGRLAGCAAPKRIVQRDGEIYGVQARNFILPEDDLVVVFFTNRSADDFVIGEVWQGKGFAFDLLSAAVGC